MHHDLVKRPTSESTWKVMTPSVDPPSGLVTTAVARRVTLW